MRDRLLEKIADWLFNFWHPRDTPDSKWRRFLCGLGYKLKIWVYEHDK
jgi:hypothetical protein